MPLIPIGGPFPFLDGGSGGGGDDDDFDQYLPPTPYLGDQADPRDDDGNGGGRNGNTSEGIFDFLAGSVDESIARQFDDERGGGIVDVSGGEFLGDVLFDRPSGVNDDVDLPGPGIGAGLLGKLNALTPGGPDADRADERVRADGAGFAPFAGAGSVRLAIIAGVVIAGIVAVGQLFTFNVGGSGS